MAKLYVSPETLEKLSNSSNSQKYARVLKAFDVNRPEPKRHQPKTQKQTHIVNSQKKSDSEADLKKSLKQLKRVIRKIKQRHHKELQPKIQTNANARTKVKIKAKTKKKKTAKKTPSKKISPEKQKRSIANITEHRAHKQYDRPAAFSFSTHLSRNTKKRTITHETTTAESYGNTNYLREQRALSRKNTSESTNLKLQYAKIKAKNNAVLQNCRKTKKSGLKHDWTDRFALK